MKINHGELAKKLAFYNDSPPFYPQAYCTQTIIRFKRKKVIFDLIYEDRRPPSTSRVNAPQSLGPTRTSMKVIISYLFILITIYYQFLLTKHSIIAK